MDYILSLVVISLIIIIGSILIELKVFKSSLFLKEFDYKNSLDTSLTIIIPTYNEESNIYNCLSAISESLVPSKTFKVLVVDDSSEDNTVPIVKQFIEKNTNKSLEIELLMAGARPKDKKWVGKNWACFRGSNIVDSKWLLFLDADVIVEKKCLYKALKMAFLDNIDLLSLAPKINCNCLSEWMVQPIMTNLLILGFPIENTNDPKNETSFAAGPFMLFKFSSYKLIGGHKEISDAIVEDLALAKKIKVANLKLSFLIAINDISLNMYRDLSSLIEGWSKNWFIGLEKNILKSISASIFVIVVNTLPYLTLIISLSFIYLTKSYNIENLLTFLLSSLAIITHYLKRRYLNYKFKIPMDFWYLNFLGGLIVFYISYLSIFKTIFGVGWTWKGRRLN